MSTLTLITEWLVHHDTDLTLREVEALAAERESNAVRLWEALSSERDYCARNAAANDPMHRKVPYYEPILHSWYAILTAETNPAGVETAWCETCRRRREVVEVDNHASYYQGAYEIEVTATHLACSHTMQGPERIVGRSPGGEAAAEAIRGAEVQRRVARTAEAAFSDRRA